MSEMNEKDLEQVVGGDETGVIIADIHELMKKRDCGDCSATNKLSCQSSLRDMIRERVMKNATMPLHCPWKH